MEHSYQHQADDMAEHQKQKKAAITQFKALLLRYEEANVDYLHTEDEDYANLLKVEREKLSDSLYQMYCDNEGNEEIERLWNYYL
jgi:hypothetical protein